jgi:hypothetical protein
MFECVDKSPPTTKNIHMKRILISFLILLSQALLAQGIDDLLIIPDDPITPEDNVSVIAYATHPNSGCPIVQTGITQFEDTIYVYVEHEMGLLTAICNSIDTIGLGNFVPGTYTVEYQFNTGSEGMPSFSDTLRVEFTVQSINRTKPTEYADKIVQLFPNPGARFIMVETAYRGEMAVFNLNGKQLHRFEITQSPFRLGLEGMDPGIYFLLPLEDNQVGWAARFVVE